MAVYFTDFPTIGYDIQKTGTKIQSIDILKRFKPLESLLVRCTIYYDYYILDGERPDMVSQRYYETVDHDWIILMFNSMYDPYFDWPLSTQEMTLFLEKKYGSVRNATQTVHHYERIIQQKEKFFDGTIVPERTLVIDEDSYLALPEEDRKKIYNYDYEHTLNEKKRSIRVPNPRYIPQLVAEKRKMFK